MELKLADFREEADEKFHYNLRRGLGNLERKKKSSAVKWFQRAIGWAMDHRQDYQARQFLKKAERLP